MQHLMTLAFLVASHGRAGQVDDLKDRPSFTVASVKPSEAGAQGIRLSTGPGGRLAAANVTLRFLVKIAYDLRDDQIGGGPNWFGSARYNVEGKCDPPVSDNLPKPEYQRQVHLRLQSLLAERFQLKLKHDSKEMMVFHLVAGKNGPKMQEVAHAPGAKTGFRVSNSHMEASDTDMESLAGFLGEETSRVVMNKTGLTAHYSFKLDWTPDPNLGVGHGDDVSVDSSGPSLFTAVQQQLGLKLEAHKDAAPFMIVERAEIPAAN